MKSGEKRLFLMVLAVAVALTLVALYPVWQQQRQAAAMAVQEVSTPHEQILGDARHNRGPSDAPFTLVEFADYTCTHCAEAAPYVDSLVRKHARDLRHVFRCFPIERHPSARICAAAAEAAALQGKYWEMESRLFATSGEKDDSEIDAAALGAGLKMDRYHKDLNSAKCEELVARDERDANTLGIKITPTFFFISPRHTYRILGVDFLKGFLADPEHWR